MLARLGITNSIMTTTPLDPDVHLTPLSRVPLNDASFYWQHVGNLIMA